MYRRVGDNVLESFELTDNECSVGYEKISKSVSFAYRMVRVRVRVSDPTGKHMRHRGDIFLFLREIQSLVSSISNFGTAIDHV